MIHYIYRIKVKNHMFILIDVKIFDRIEYSFIIYENLEKNGKLP